MKRKTVFRRVCLLLLVVALLLVGRPLVFTLYNWYADPAPAPVVEHRDTVNDASGLNAWPVDTVVQVAAGRAEAEAQLVQLVKQAAATGKKISIAGARHSMGGHTIAQQGIVINMKPFRHLELDTITNLLTAGAGAIWADIIPYLDKHGRSVAVMQSNNSFSVGGSISVNCHGWQPNTRPIAGSVESFRLLDAAGRILTCSRQENAELFSLVLGGYGLFGIIVDVQLRVVPNRMYTLRQYVIPSAAYIRTYEEKAMAAGNVGMVYGRLNINKSNFLNEAILSVFSVDSGAVIKSLEKTGFSGLRRAVFRGSANSGYGKTLRWRAEKWGTRFVAGKAFSRNQLINEPVEIFQNTRPGYTDILHEYFIPKDSVTKFIAVLRQVLPQYDADLLNITLRNLMKDDDTFLRYARERSVWICNAVQPGYHAGSGESDGSAYAETDR